MNEEYKPSWLEGTETRQEEALWPYASCVIANMNVKTQNIGILKGMAKDKARNKKVDVPVTLHLPDGTEQVIVFHPDGTQEERESVTTKRLKEAFRKYRR